MRLVRFQKHTLAHFQLDHIEDERTEYAYIIGELRVELEDQVDEGTFFRGLTSGVGVGLGVPGDQRSEGGLDLFLRGGHEDLKDLLQGILLILVGLLDLALARLGTPDKRLDLGEPTLLAFLRGETDVDRTRLSLEGCFSDQAAHFGDGG